MRNKIRLAQVEMADMRSDTSRRYIGVGGIVNGKHKTT